MYIKIFVKILRLIKWF